MNKAHYFDWAATAPGDEDIWNEALRIALENGANPSSVHGAGIEARHVINDCRKRCAAALGINEQSVVFTSGGTESDHLPMLSLLQRPSKGTILVSAIEHPALQNQAEMMKRTGWKVVTIPCDNRGIVTPEAVTSRLTPDTALVCVMAVNNETGAIQPVTEIADAITVACQGKRRPLFHVDAVQAIGKIPLALSHKGIDTAAISAHKLCGPRGIGLMYMAKRFEPFLRGGNQEDGIRSGTENLFGIVGLTLALERYALLPGKAADEKLALQIERTRNFIAELKTLPWCRIVPDSRDGSTEGTLYSPGVVQASFKNIPGEVMVRALSEKGFYISTGSACSSKKASRPILAAMGISADEAETAVRFSFSSHSTDEGTAELLAAVKEIAGAFNRS